MESIRWGILGTGAIAKAFAEALKETEGELVAVASNTESRAKKFCDAYDCSPIQGYQNLISEIKHHHKHIRCRCYCLGVVIRVFILQLLFRSPPARVQFIRG